MSYRTHMSNEYFNEVMKSGAFSDFKITCQGTEFKVHKIMLSSTCEFFRKMFQHECQETRDGVVDLPDEDPDIVAIMLRFIYTGECSPKDVVYMDDNKAVVFSEDHDESSEDRNSFLKEYNRLGIELALKFVKVYQIAEKCALNQLHYLAFQAITRRPLFTEDGRLTTGLVVQHPGFPMLVEEIMGLTFHDESLRSETVYEVAEYIHKKAADYRPKDDMVAELAKVKQSYDPEAFRLAWNKAVDPDAEEEGW